MSLLLKVYKTKVEARCILVSHNRDQKRKVVKEFMYAAVTQLFPRSQ
jgi:hypothetical protein